MKKMRWSQLRIAVRDMLPPDAYAGAFGRTIVLSKKFALMLKEGNISDFFFRFVILHEIVHVAQQTFLSRIISKEKLSSFIKKNRIYLEKNADEVAFGLMLSGEWDYIIKLYLGYDAAGSVDLCDNDFYTIQYWMVNGAFAVMQAGEINDFSEIEDRKELLNKIDKDLVNSGLVDNNHSLANTWVDLQASAQSQGIHETFTMDAFDELYKKMPNKHKGYFTIEDENNPKKTHVIPFLKTEGSDDKIERTSLVIGSSFNDRWFYPNIYFGGLYITNLDSFLNATHKGSMQFLHSTDCSYGNKKENLKKICRWTEFCIDVFHNIQVSVTKKERKNIQEISIEEYIESLPMNDVFRNMFSDLLTTANTYRKMLIKVFFGYPDWNPGSVAIGSVSHMIQDSFALSHAKRCLDPFLCCPEDDGMDMIFDEIEKKACNPLAKDLSCAEINSTFLDCLKKKAMPIIVFTDYTAQKSGKHSHADIFVRELNADDSQFENFYKKTLNATMARDCTKAFIYMLLKDYSRDEICDFVESLYPLTESSLDVTKSGLQYYKGPKVDSKYGCLKDAWDTYGSNIEKLMCYNVKEGLDSRIEVFLFVVNNLKHLLLCADWKLSAYEFSSYVESILYHLTEIIVEIEAITQIIIKEIVDENNTKSKILEFKRHVGKANAFSLQKLINCIEILLGLFDLKVEKKIKGAAKIHYLKEIINRSRCVLESVKKNIKVLALDSACELNEIADEMKKETSSFVVNIYTTDKLLAGTDADVYISIIGKLGIIPFTKLDAYGDCFERGGMNTFTIYSKESVGNISEIRVKTYSDPESTIDKDDWHLDKITIMDSLSAKIWFFSPSCWIEKNHEVSLLAQEEYSCFVLDVFTSDISGAGTNADVFVSIEGENGKCIPYTKLNDDKDNFERCDKDSFRISSKTSIGEISKVRIKQDGSGGGSDWHLDKIVITDVVTERKWIFIAECWIEKNKEVVLSLQDSCGFTLDVYTGNKLYAGTNADVFVSIVGKNGAVIPYKKINDSKDNFEKGDKDSFTIGAKKHIEEILKIKVRQNGTGAGADWFLEKIVLTNTMSEMTQFFCANCWIEANKEMELFPQEKCSCFKLDFYTRDKLLAGTDADVLASIIGENGKIIPYTKLNDSKNNFESGDRDSFILKADFSIEDIVELKIKLCATKTSAPDWHLDKVIITDEVTEDRWLFLVNDVIGFGEGKKSEIVLKPNVSNVL